MIEGDIIERAADAIRSTRHGKVLSKEFSLIAARAVIEAIREPTSQMLNPDKAIEYTMPEGEFNIMYDVATKYGVWQAMIDAALQSASNHNPPLEKA